MALTTHSDLIAVANAGSSSLKFSLYEWHEGNALTLLMRGLVEGLGTAPHFVAKSPSGNILGERALDPGAALGHDAALHHVIEFVRDLVPDIQLRGIGHRVVHGGLAHAQPVQVTPTVLEDLQALSPLAPLHQPHNLSPIRLAFDALPGVPQVACFDTAFHRAHAEVAQMYALPYALHASGVRRYGFHGLSYEYIASRLPQVAPELAQGKVIALHLGNGASLCALEGGHSVDSTMGFTALDGLPMGTRCGAVDPGVLLYLLQAKGMDAEQVESMLYRESGLLGVSGISSDMRVLLASDAPRAQLAVDLFVYRILREIGSLAAALGGVDGIVFTGGIGENAAEIRRRVVKGLAWLGFSLDSQANGAGGPCISAAGSARSAWVIPTDEEWMIASHTVQLLGVRPEQISA
jgi:acetate kinase